MRTISVIFAILLPAIAVTISIALWSGAETGGQGMGVAIAGGGSLFLFFASIISAAIGMAFLGSNNPEGPGPGDENFRDFGKWLRSIMPFVAGIGIVLVAVGEFTGSPRQGETFAFYGYLMLGYGVLLWVYGGKVFARENARLSSGGAVWIRK